MLFLFAITRLSTGVTVAIQDFAVVVFYHAGHVGHAAIADFSSSSSVMTIVF